MKKAAWILTVLSEAGELDSLEEKTRELLVKIAEELDKQKASEKMGRLGEKGEAAGEPDKGNEPVKAKLVRKDDLDQVIPEVNFTAARLDEVIDYISRRCEVNLILDERAIKMGVAKPAPPGFDESDESAELWDPRMTEPRLDEIGGITIRLKNVPLKAVLKYALQSKGLTYIVEDYAIVIVPQGYVSQEDMETMIFHLYTSGDAGRYSLRNGF